MIKKILFPAMVLVSISSFFFFQADEDGIVINGLKVSRQVIHHPAMLVEEVAAAPKSEKLLQADFLLENVESRPVTWKLYSKSCSCIGLNADGGPLNDELTFMPGQTRLVQIETISKPQVQNIRYEVILRREGCSDEAKQLKLQSTAEVLTGLVMMPEHVIVRASELEGKATVSQSISVRHIHRSNGPPPNAAPLIRVGAGTDHWVKNSGEPNHTHLREDIWLSSYKYTLDIDSDYLRQPIAGGVTITMPKSEGLSRTIPVTFLQDMGVICPAAVNMGTILESGTSRFQIASGDDAPMSILGIDS